MTQYVVGATSNPLQYLVTVDAALGDIAPIVATLTPKITQNSPTQYKLELPTGATGVGFFTLTGSFGTKRLPFDATADDIKAATGAHDGRRAPAASSR